MFVLVHPILTDPFPGSIDLLQEMKGENPDGAEVAKIIIAALMRCYPEPTIVEFLGGVVTGIDAVISAPPTAGRRRGRAFQRRDRGDRNAGAEKANAGPDPYRGRTYAPATLLPAGAARKEMSSAQRRGIRTPG